MTYDEKSLDLAKHFLSDYKFATDEEQKRFENRLATEIQATVEAWLEDYAKDNLTPPVWP